MKKRVLLLGTFVLLFAGAIVIYVFDINLKYDVGQKIDSFNGVAVFYNGKIKNVHGRALTENGYNIGLKYQCVEFVKRYYYEALDHKMPNTYGHAKDFFISGLKDGQINTQRNLVQYTNPSESKPKKHDLIVYAETPYNKYGHVSIVSKVNDKRVEIIQQNAGLYGKRSRR